MSRWVRPSDTEGFCVNDIWIRLDGEEYDRVQDFDPAHETCEALQNFLGFLQALLAASREDG